MRKKYELNGKRRKVVGVDEQSGRYLVKLHIGDSLLTKSVMCALLVELNLCRPRSSKHATNVARSRRAARHAKVVIGKGISWSAAKTPESVS